MTARPLVLAVSLLTFFFFFAYGPLEVALPVAARVTFHTNSAGYGAMWSAYAVGSVAGLLVLRAQYQRFQTTTILCAIAVMWGVLSMALAFTHVLAAAMIVLLIAGFLWSPYNALESAFMQVQVPEHVQGAVFSMQSSFLYMLAVPLGAMAGGWVLAHTTPQNVMLLSGGACVVAGAIGYASTARARDAKEVSRIPP
ncbi:MAG TPA: MFS transporter [Candidatus Baltobacteraceae bacterium]|nr:MFS transporter [Candidatus Baltobacteraceae bacterium]